MGYIGKTVRLSGEFLRNTGQITGDGPLQYGVVVKETPIGDSGLFLVEVDDAAFGRWKALSSNIEVVVQRSCSPANG